MGVYSRKDSPWWWLYLETTQTKEKTQVRVGTTTQQRKDSKVLAEQVYHQRMNDLAARVHRLPTARPAIRFSAYADTYARDTIPHRKGHEREGELLNGLRAGFERELLSAIDQDLVRRWMTVRRQTVSASTVNREVDLLKSMLRDAVPKYLDNSPLTGMKRLTGPEPKRRLLTPAEERRLLKAATRPDLKALIILGIDTLVRFGDLLDLQRTDRQGGWLYIRDPKSGLAYDVALSPRAAKALDRLKGDQTYYFHTFRGAEKARDRRARVRKLLKAACAVARIPFGKAESGITFHWATRRTGATRLLVKKRVPIPTVQRLGNWKNPDMLLKIYAESDRRAMQKAVGAFPARSRSRRKSA